MANHCVVKSRKKHTPEQITQLLTELNTSHFAGKLTWEYHESTDADSGWGKYTWLISYKEDAKDGPDDGEWCRRVMWSDTPNHFELRHGPGGYFAWWISTVILHAVAYRFNGSVLDEGDGERRKPKKNPYPKFSDFLDMMYNYRRNRDPQLTRYLKQQEMHLTPPSHRIDLGEPVVYRGLMRLR